MINYQQFIINDCFTAVIAHSGPEPDFSCTLYEISRIEIFQKKIKNICHQDKYLVIEKKKCRRKRQSLIFPQYIDHTSDG